MYKTVVVDYEPVAKRMAKQIDDKINDMYRDGYELVTMTETTSARAILVFKEIGKS